MAETIATGYAFQGRMLRWALVGVQTPGEALPEAANPLFFGEQS